MDAMVQRRGAAGSAEVKHAVVIVGGGAAGITVAAELKRHDPGLTSPLSSRRGFTGTSRAGRWSAPVSFAASRPNGARKS